MARLLPLLLLILTVAAPTRAQHATVVGTVNEIVGDQYYPIPFAKVSLKNGDHVTHPVVPDIEGKFSIEGVPAGIYMLQVKAVGFDTLTEEVKLAAGDSLTVRIRLGDKSLAGILLEPEGGFGTGQRLGGSEQ
jgi:hypothetical protein